MKPFITPGVTGPAVTEIARAPTRLTDPAQAWTSEAQSARGVQETQGGVRRNRDTFSTRNKHFPVLANLFPFAVYNLPAVLRTTPDDGNDWRKFRCHGGWAMGANSANTDGCDSDSHPEYLGNFAAAYDVWIPNSTNAFYFWLEISGSNSRVLYGDNRAANSYGDTTSTPNHPWDHNSSPWNTVGPWTSAPVPDGNHVPIATIFPDPPNLRANVRQYQRTDLSNTSGGGNSQVQYVQITALGGANNLDYITCGNLNVAKKPLMRPSILNVTWYGTQYDFNYVNDNQRNSTIHGTNNVEIELAYPPYVVNDYIFIQISSNGTGISNVAQNANTWYDTTDRVWMREYGQ